jgi:hypothetical protein
MNLLREHTSYCMNEAEWEQFVAQVGPGTVMSCDCEECGMFTTPTTVHDSHRCDCGNRRCSIVLDESGRYFYVEVY